MVTAIIDMGKNLKQCVIAEGIETEEQRAFLLTHPVRKDKAISSAGPWPPPNLCIYFRWA
jgi:predicted signal transduction protein with EAL and GGDEF domain